LSFPMTLFWALATINDIFKIRLFLLYKIPSLRQY
jgi:hypothetical protein